AVPTLARLLAVSAHLDDAIGDRESAIGVRVLLLPAFPPGIADVEAGEVADRERPHRVAEIDHHLVDLLGERALLDEDVHLGIEGRPAAVGEETVTISANHADLADLLRELAEGGDRGLVALRAL